MSYRHMPIVSSLATEPDGLPEGFSLQTYIGRSVSIRFEVFFT